jgi:leucyl aminopeptidase
MEKRLKRFTSFFNRYYTSKSGHESSEWLYQRIVSTLEHQKSLNTQLGLLNTLPEITVDKFNHSWTQPSIIVHIPGSAADPIEREKVVIVGSHQDDTGGFFGKYLRAPGADDDGKALTNKQCRSK